MKLETPACFEDVAVTFSDEEWNILNEQKKKLYMEVMVQNYELMTSVGYCIPKEKLLALIARDKRHPANYGKGKLEKKHRSYLENTQHFIISSDSPSELLEGHEQSAGRRHFRCASHKVVFSEQVPLIENNTRKHQTYQMEKHLEQNTKLADDHGTQARDKTSKFNICKKRNARKRSAVTEQQKVQTRAAAFQCANCEKSFRYKQQLTRHRNMHTNEHERSCTQQRETRKCQKNQNSTHKNENSTKQVESDTSVNVFQNARHQQIQSKGRPYKCSECEKCYKNKSHLNRHKLSHTDLRPYKCAVCGKTYRHKHELSRHQWLHTERRPFECTLCGKGYTRKHEFLLHKRAHNGEILFSCSDCGKSFKRKRSLVEHQFSHSEVQLYKCVKCGKSFGSQSRLTRHEIIHTQEKPFKCSECERSFNYGPHLTRHKAIHTRKPVCKA